MTMRKTGDLLVSNGTYKQGGEEKTRYLKLGAIFTDHQSGRESIKLDATPTKSDWNGWIGVFRDQPEETAEAAAGDHEKQGDTDDRMPF